MNAALQFIEVIASNMPEVRKPLVSILEILEDGEALAYLGATDEDQHMIEEAYEIVNDWIADGREFLR